MDKSKNFDSNFQQPQNSEEGTILLSDIVLSLARHIKVIFIVPMILCIVTIIYALYFTKPVFTSTSKIMSSSKVVGSRYLAAAQFGINYVII